MRAEASDPPDGLSRRRNLELAGRDRHLWYRRILFGLIVVLPLLALANVFGQQPQRSTAATQAASFRVSAPTRLRGGLIYQARFTVAARVALRHPQLILDPGWFESMSVNSVVPDPVSQSSANGRVVLSYGPLQPGQSLTAWIYYQANPDNLGKRSQGAALYDGPRPVARVERSVTVFP